MKHMRLFFLVAVLISIPYTPCIAEGKKGNEIGRDGRFVAYSKGIVINTQTGLMWASRDNGSDITWSGAKSYCEDYKGAGYTDWRMPTIDELAGIYDPDKENKYGFYVTMLISITSCCPWSSETRGSGAAKSFDFHFGGQTWFAQSLFGSYRALPVRSGN